MHQRLSGSHTPEFGEEPNHEVFCTARQAMTYRTILVHCNDKKRIGRIVGAAVELAERSQAHVVGLSISPPFLVIPAGMPGTPDTLALDERAQVYRGGDRFCHALRMPMQPAPSPSQSR